jgi:ribonucleoside-triphosphate reductase
MSDVKVLPEPIVGYLANLNNSFSKNKLKKRNGRTEDFNLMKVHHAISKSFGNVDCDYTAANATYQVCHELLHGKDYTPDYVFDVEEIQNEIEVVLMKIYPEIAKKYIIYREQRAKAREDKKAFDVTKIMRTYLDMEDWRVKENSNSGYSIGGLIMHNASTMVSHYWLNNVYPKEIKDAHTNADIHIHDLGFLGAYCQGHSLGQLIEEGLHAINGNLASSPAKHFHTLINHIVNYFGILQNESAGAQAFSSFDTYVAPFIAYDDLDYKEVKQIVQSLLFGLNIPSRWGSQSMFTNITLDIKVNPTLADRPVVIGGKWWLNNNDDHSGRELVDINSVSFDHKGVLKYRAFQREMDMFNTAFLELMYDGDKNGRIFSYPIPTINITREFDWDSPVANLLWKLTGKYGTPYFSNFINSDMKPEDSFSMCPLTGDTEILCKSDESVMYYDTIKTIYEKGKTVKVWDGFKWCDAKPNKQEPTVVYKITTEDGRTVSMGENHLQLIRWSSDDDNFSLAVTLAKNLKTGDELPYDCTGDSFLKTAEFEYTKIANIDVLENKEPLYCLEVDNENCWFMLSNRIMTHNCRLRLDKKELRKRGGGLFGAAEKTGSIGVVTINLPRLAYRVKRYSETMILPSGPLELYLTELNKLLELAKDSLEIKRKTVNLLTEQGLFPYTKKYLRNWNNHFSTIGILGMNEACLNLFGMDISDEGCRKFALDVGDFIRNRISSFQEETGNLYNYESTPGESTSYRFAKSDKKQFPDIITAGDPDGDVYYTNSTNLPVNHTIDMFDALDHQDELLTQYTGGCVFHGFLGESIDNPETVKKLVKSVAENYKLPYFSLTPTFSVCKTHGYLKGKQEICSTCGEANEVYSRVVGYYRPINNWNKGKKQEFKERVTYNTPE